MASFSACGGIAFLLQIGSTCHVAQDAGTMQLIAGSIIGAVMVLAERRSWDKPTCSICKHNLLYIFTRGSVYFKSFGSAIASPLTPPFPPSDSGGCAELCPKRSSEVQVNDDQFSGNRLPYFFARFVR